MKSKFLFAMIERNIFSRKGFIVGVLIVEFDKNIATYLWRSGFSMPCSGGFIGFSREWGHSLLRIHGPELNLHFLLHLYIITFSHKAFHPDSLFQLCAFQHIIVSLLLMLLHSCKHLLLFPNTTSTAHFLPVLKSIKILPPLENVFWMWESFSFK